MTWSLANAADRNRDALLRVLAALFAMVGIVPGGGVPSLRRCVRSMVLKVLLPAESAARCLVVIEGVRLLKDGFTARLRVVPAASVRKARAKDADADRGGKRVPGFPLFDTRQRFEERRRKYAKGPGPRIFFFDDRDPPFEPLIEPPEPMPDDLLNATRICGRLAALQDVLTDLARHARRYALWQVRFDATPSKPGRVMHVLRPGWRPGHRARPFHPVDEILSNCDSLARYSLRPPDTS